MGIFRALPPAAADNNPNDAAPGRHGVYGDEYVIPVGAGFLSAADEGSYFVATNPTVGTGIAGHAAPVVADADTKPLIHLFNGGTKNIALDFFEVSVTAAGTAGTLSYAVVYTDNDGATSRSSGGTAITAIVNTNSASPVTTGATVFFGPVVSAGTSPRKLGSQLMREVIPVVQDSVRLNFGPSGAGAHSPLTTAGTATNHIELNFPPVVVAPGGNVGVVFIRASQSAASSYTFNLGYVER